MKSGDLYIYAGRWGRETICVYLHALGSGFHWVHMSDIGENSVVHEDTIAKLEEK
jgi:hypothetical protein